MTTAETLARFHAEYQIPQSISTQRQGEQLRELQRLAEWLEKPLLDLTQQDVLNWLGAKLTRGLSPNSVRTQYMMLRSFVTWARMAGLVPEDRANMIRLVASPRGSSPRMRPNPYTPTQVRQFRALLAAKYPALPEYGRGSRLLPRYLRGQSDALRRALWRHARRVQFEAQLALALELGMRGVEIHGLSIKAAHPINDALVIRTAKQGPGEPVYREIPWTAHANAVMQEWLDFRALLHPQHESLWIMLAYQGTGAEQLGPLTIDQFHRALRVFGAGWRWHRFRHTAATEWLRAKMPFEKVQSLLGHSRPEETLAYTQILRQDIGDAMADAQEEFARRMGLAA